MSPKLGVLSVHLEDREREDSSLSDPRRSDVTEILLSLGSDGPDNLAAQEKLYTAVYDELRQVAARLMRREREGHTLQPTALVNEAYLRLVDQNRIGWRDRAHFFATAAIVMRRILVDHARARDASKRGGVWRRVTLTDQIAVGESGLLDTIALDQALSKLSEMDGRMARVVEMRFFAGMKMEEIAHVLGVSRRTVAEDWNMAKRWLRKALSS